MKAGDTCPGCGAELRVLRGVFDLIHCERSGCPMERSDVRQALLQLGEQVKMARDRLLYGNSFEEKATGRRVDPRHISLDSQTRMFEIRPPPDFPPETYDRPRVIQAARNFTEAELCKMRIAIQEMKSSLTTQVIAIEPGKLPAHWAEEVGVVEEP